MVWAYIRIKEMCLKKSALLTMILMLILAGCGNKKIVVHEYAKDYLNLIKGSDCIIDSYDMKAIKDIHLECLEPDLLSIIEKIRQEQFVETVQCTLKKENKAAENDLIELKLSFPEDQSEKTSVQKLYVVCSDDGTSFPVLQKELVGKEVGYEGVVSDTREGYRKTLPSGEILFVVENIYNCDFFPAYVDSLKYSNVYTIAQFYDYMIAMRVNEKVFDLRFQFRQDFLSECLKNCRFSYSNDQIEAIAEKKARKNFIAAYASPVSFLMQQFLYFLPLPQGQGSFRPTFAFLRRAASKEMISPPSGSSLPVTISAVVWPLSFHIRSD